MRTMERKTSKASVSNISLSKYTPKSYVEKEKKGIVYYGENNDFPEYLISLFYGSPTHGSICKTVAQMVFSDGLQGDQAANMAIAKLNLNDVAEKCALDYVIQGGFCFEIAYSMDRSTIASVRHVEFERIRAQKCDEEGYVDWYVYSEDWTDPRKAKETTEIKAFDPKVKGEYPTQLVYVKPFTAGASHYPKPDYLGAVNYIELEKSISEYLINHMNNGMTPSMWLHFLNGEPDDEEKRIIEREVRSKYQGAENAGEIVITYSDGQDRKPEIDFVPVSDAPEQWSFISEHVTDKILIAHRVTTPILFGVKTPGQLGATGELEIGKQLFDEQKIKPMQRHIRDAFNMVIAESGSVGRLALSEAKKDMTEADEAAWIAYLKDRGEDIDLDVWEEVLAEDAISHEDALEAEQRYQALTLFGEYAAPQEKSEWGDSGLYKLRYRYKGGTSEKSRPFCVEMVGLAQQGKVFRYEDIKEMSDDGVNGGLAPAGKSKYDIFLHKGGANCHHSWQRVIFFRKDEKGKFLPKSKTDEMENDKRVGNVPYVPKKGQEGDRPIDRPKKGYLSQLIKKVSDAITQ